MKQTCKPLLTALALVCTLTSACAQSVTFTNSASVDAFVRASVASSNYGGAGALEVSGPTATNASGVMNGAFDSLLRFNTAGMVSSLNTAYGGTNWGITGVTLKVTEQAAPSQAIFNRGTGQFEIRWIANDGWIEGTGVPNTPTTDGVTYNDVAGLLTSGTDATLGTFANAGINGLNTFSFALPAGFVNDLRAGGEVGLYLTAVSPDIGFNFDSRSFGTTSLRPVLEVTAVPEPGVTALAVLGLTLVAGKKVARRRSKSSH